MSRAMFLVWLEPVCLNTFSPFTLCLYDYVKVFSMALNAQRPPDNLPVDFAQVTADVETLYKSGQGRPGTKEVRFFSLFSFTVLKIR